MRVHNKRNMLKNVIDRADVTTFMQCNKGLHILSPESNIRKCANGLRVITDRLTNGTVAVWRIRIQIAVEDVVVFEVRTSLQKLDADVDLVSITSF